LSVLLLALAAAPMAPAASNDWVPGATYDSRVPTIRQVLGFEPGTRLTTFYETEKLLRAWADAVPDRTRLLEFGEDYEGKTLYHLVISSPDNIRDLEGIRERWSRLADPRRLGGAAALDEIARATPASFLISTIDTTEASSVEAMQVIAYHLLAGTDPRTERLLQNLVVHIVPVENPAARERYVAWYNAEMSVNEACAFECRRLFGDEASFTAGNFEMLAENIFCDRSAGWYKPGGINGARIGLPVHHPTNTRTPDVSVVRTQQGGVMIRHDFFDFAPPRI
jgi:hypothetical protein